MEQLLESGRVDGALRALGDWFAAMATDPWALAQLVILIVLFAVSALLARRVRPWLDDRLRHWTVPARLAALARTVPTILTPLIWLVLSWFAIAVAQYSAWPARTYLIDVAASLLTAWVVIRLLTTFLRNPALAKALAYCAWTVAALNILGLLAPTLAFLDSLAFSVGELRLSVLTLLKGALMLALFLWLASGLSRFADQRIRRIADLTPSVQVLLGKLVKIGLITLAVVIALDSVGIDLTALAVFSGAVGVGVGFGLQKVVSNLISGMILLLDKSIKPGDVIEVGSTFGWISALGARYVSVVTRDGKEYLIPNEDLITQHVVNWSFSNELVRVEVGFGVSYRSDPHAVRAIALEAATKPARVAEDPPPVCHLSGFGESSLDFVLRFWIRDPQEGVMNVKGQVLLAVWDAFKRNGIEIPFPHRNLVVTQPIPVETRPAPGIPVP